MIFCIMKYLTQISTLPIRIIVDIYDLVMKNDINLDPSLLRFGERVTGIICF